MEPTLQQATAPVTPAVPAAAPVVPAAAPAVASPAPQPQTLPGGISPIAINAAKAIRQVESGGNYSATSKDGSFGAYQFLQPTWDAAAKKYLGTAVPWTEATPEQQNEVAVKQINDWIQSGKATNIGQIASMWNAGEGNPNAYLENVKGTNSSGVAYNTPAYAKKVATLYQQIKSGAYVPPANNTGTDNPAADVAAERAELEAAGQPVSVNPNKAAPSFFGGLIRGIIAPVVRGVNTIVEPIQKVVTGNDNPDEYNSYLGDVSGLGMKQGQTTAERVKDVVGGLANLGADFVGGDGVVGAADAGLEGLAKQAAIQGAKEGATAGALGGFGSAMQAPDTGETIGQQALDVAKGTAEGAAGGAVTGGAFGGLTAGAGALKNLAFGADTSAGEDAVAKLAKNPVVQKRAAVIQQLGDNYASVGKVIQKAKSQGIDLPTILASTDLLHDTVDNTGTIRTQPAIDELNAFLKEGPEQVVSKNLQQEGASVPLKDVQAQLNQAVNQSSLTGSSKVTALNSVKKEIAGLQLDTDKDGNIPLSTIHQAKVNKYANVNYMNPESGTADKLIGKTLKGIVEDNTKSINVKNLNKELSQHYATLDLLEKLNGKKVQGGKLGKYFAQTIGGIVGSHFGPLGTIAGSEIGGAIKGRALSSVFGGKIGTDLASSDAMKAAIESANAPRSINLPVTHEPSAYTNELPVIPFGRSPKPTVNGPVVTADTAPNVISPFGSRGVKPVIPVIPKKK